MSEGGLVRVDDRSTEPERSVVVRVDGSPPLEPPIGLLERADWRQHIARVRLEYYERRRWA